jgi:hypothetical protein
MADIHIFMSNQLLQGKHNNIMVEIIKSLSQKM